MATPTELGRTRYTQVTSVIRAVIEQIQALWKGMTPGTVEDDLQGEAGAAIVAAVAGGQLTVADAAQAYIAAQMAAQGGTAVAEALLVAEAFAGIAPDGGPLETLLYLPAIGVRRRLAAGLPPEEAMLGGLADMARYTSTAIADTARSADQVSMTANRNCVAYVRVVQLPACARCIVLAGQMYRYSEGFLRHPNCDCQTLPLREEEWPSVPSPARLFAGMSQQQQRRVFTVAGAEAIRAGADLGQVVNARRGMLRPGASTTTEGITRRGLYGRRMRRAGGEFARYPGQRYARSSTPRLTPDAIFRQASGRDEQLDLLRRYGYIV
jgi:multimeric flavodoxin WrbA